MEFFVGIDDTDNLESRGTGFVGRSMGDEINRLGLGACGAISRHQLLFDPRIPYTSHNSSLCLEIETEDPAELWEFMVEFLKKNCAPGSDCGLCMVEKNNIPKTIKSWGTKAKRLILKQADAFKLAQMENIKLIGLTGNYDGVIGSMAAVGLRAGGNDGRFVSLKGVDVRLINGTKTPLELKKLVFLHQVLTDCGEEVNDDSLISLDGWLRPINLKGKITLVVNKVENNQEYEYQLATKDFIKSISN